MPPMFGYQQNCQLRGVFLSAGRVLRDGRVDAAPRRRVRAGVADDPAGAARRRSRHDPPRADRGGSLRAGTWAKRDCRPEPWKGARGRSTRRHCKRASTPRSPATASSWPRHVRGDLLIDKPLALVGEGAPRLLGSGTGSVVRVRAADVQIERLRHRRARRRRSRSRLVRHSRRRAAGPDRRLPHSQRALRHLPARGGWSRRRARRHQRASGRDPGELGSGIHIWNTNGFTLDRQRPSSAPATACTFSRRLTGLSRGNRARDLRYGLHYMFSDDNVFEDNTFENGAAGAALMYSRRIMFRRNRFLRNRGFASVGLLLKACETSGGRQPHRRQRPRRVPRRVVAQQFRRNVIAMSDQAIVLYDSSHENGSKAMPSSPTSRRCGWSAAGRTRDSIAITGPTRRARSRRRRDRDGPYRLSNVFDHLRGNLTAADLFARGLAARPRRAERAFPVLEPMPVVDPRPLAQPPRLPDVPPPPAHMSASEAVTTLPSLACGWPVAARSPPAHAWEAADDRIPHSPTVRGQRAVDR